MTLTLFALLKSAQFVAWVAAHAALFITNRLDRTKEFFRRKAQDVMTRHRDRRACRLAQRVAYLDLLREQEETSAAMADVRARRFQARAKALVEEAAQRRKAAWKYEALILDTRLAA